MQLALHLDRPFCVADRRGFAPPVRGRFAAEDEVPSPRRTPCRLTHLPRRGQRKPAGSVFVDRPSFLANPFDDRHGMCEKRRAIMHRAWLRGELSPRVLRAARFSRAEIDALCRLRGRVLKHLPSLRGRDVVCRCRQGSRWCHGDELLAIANA